MEVINLSWNDVKDETLKLYTKISKTYTPDIVIFIAKGGYEIGRILSEKFQCPMVEIYAKREKSIIKKIAEPFLPYIPKKICSILRNREVNSGYHDENSNRKVYFDMGQLKSCENIKNILLVDDSVDTGYSVKQCIDTIKSIFINCEVKIASLNIFSKSENVVRTDFYVYKNKCMAGPWSSDSRELKTFNKQYKNWSNKMYSKKGLYNDK